MKKPKELEMLLRVFGVQAHQSLPTFDRLDCSTAKLQRSGEGAVCVPRKRIKLHGDSRFAHGLIQPPQTDEQECVPLVGDDVVPVGRDGSTKVRFGGRVVVSESIE